MQTYKIVGNGNGGGRLDYEGVLLRLHISNIFGNVEHQNKVDSATQNDLDARQCNPPSFLEM